MGRPAYIQAFRTTCQVPPPQAPRVAVVDLGVEWRRATNKIDLEASPAAAAEAVERFVETVRDLLERVVPTVEELWVSEGCFLLLSAAFCCFLLPCSVLLLLLLLLLLLQVELLAPPHPPTHSCVLCVARHNASAAGRRRRQCL